MRLALLLAVVVPLAFGAACGGKHEGIATSPQQAPSTPADGSDSGNGDSDSDESAPPAPGQPDPGAPPEGPTQGPEQTPTPKPPKL